MSASGWVGPSEGWDTHSRPLANRALKNARAEGWWLKKSSGRAKVWGVISCGDPATVDKSQRCSKSVLSTSGPADGSETAIVIDEAVADCTHERPLAGPVDTEVDAAVREAEVKVESAESAVASAEFLRDHGAHQDLMNDYLEQSVSETESAESWLLRAGEEQARAEAAIDEARRSAVSSGASVSLGAAGMATRAETQASDAKVVLLHSPGRDAAVLRGRCDDVLDRVARLRST